MKKLLTIKDFDKVLISYLRTPSKLTAKVVYNKMGSPYAEIVKVGGEKIGIVVAIAPDVLGWSLCKTKDDCGDADKFDKKRGISIALSRANYASNLSEKERFEYYAEKLPDSLLDLFGEMNTRAEKYFNYKKEDASN